MSGTNGKKALHVATFSGWYRFEQNGKQFTQTKRGLELLDAHLHDRGRERSQDDLRRHRALGTFLH